MMVSRRMQALAAVFCSLALGISASAAALGDADPEAEGEPPPLISSRDLTAILGNSPVLTWQGSCDPTIEQLRHHEISPNREYQTASLISGFRLQIFYYNESEIITFKIGHCTKD